ncbi:hypothetical protein [Paenibacillus donghaensis]|uniref:Uncharacterized protein n=1 Tax=Paenibacillus donghaensis TaxID=414771 RepID=A0A2Z2KIL8_9BACL|nr:hypothetical protein [Paenibacillus donghaensis]ASA20722.1 hypothetical protein B9T62_07925 [Paenibacillus donghaensis]
MKSALFAHFSLLAPIFEKDLRYNMWYSLKADEHNILLQKLEKLLKTCFCRLFDIDKINFRDTFSPAEAGAGSLCCGYQIKAHI